MGLFGPKFITPQRVNVNVDSHQTVTEKRAPTDESVRLLGEMQKAAEDRLVCSISCQSTKFSFTAHVFDNHMEFEQRMRVRFSLGDSNYDLNVKLDRDTPHSREQYISAVHKLLSETIAAKILSGSYSEFAKIRQFR